MNILITGATSKIGQFLIPELLKNQNIKKFYILSRNSSPQFNHLKDERIEFIQGDLTREIDFLEPSLKIDLCLHMAAITHTTKPEEYFKVNQEGTQRLASYLYSNGCKQFIFISSQTAGLSAGDYAESKFNCEKILFEMPWTQLLVLRPSEVYGAGSNEGIDKFESLAKKRKIYPWLIASKKIQFSPFKIEDLTQYISNAIKEGLQGQRLQILRGPIISSTELAKYYWKNFHALPIPVYVSVLAIINHILSLFGFNLFPKDQISRLLGMREQKPTHKVEIEEIVFKSPFKL